MSKRAREAANKRMAAELFPPGYWESLEPTPEEKAEANRKSRLAYAQTLLGLADQGMQPRKYRKLAEQIIKENTHPTTTQPE